MPLTDIRRAEIERILKIAPSAAQDGNWAECYMEDVKDLLEAHDHWKKKAEETACKE